ncbi:hypothetical protein BDV93DRAFT_510972 [Ceratobasidium sp. AG-I]|nr:hypothetical protein BDV93DRAFT_510972 [Ceratobasidium sp. AG-I]
MVALDIRDQGLTDSSVLVAYKATLFSTRGNPTAIGISGYPNEHRIDQDHKNDILYACNPAIPRSFRKTKSYWRSASPYNSVCLDREVILSGYAKRVQNYMILSVTYKFNCTTCKTATPSPGGFRSTLQLALPARSRAPSEKKTDITSVSVLRPTRVAIERGSREQQLEGKGKRQYMDHTLTFSTYTATSLPHFRFFSPKSARVVSPVADKVQVLMRDWMTSGSIPPTSPYLQLSSLVSIGYVMQLQPSPMLTDFEVTAPCDCTRTPATSRNGPGLWLSRTEREGRVIFYSRNLDHSRGGVGETPEDPVISYPLTPCVWMSNEAQLVDDRPTTRIRSKLDTNPATMDAAGKGSEDSRAARRAFETSECGAWWFRGRTRTSWRADGTKHTKSSWLSDIVVRSEIPTTIPAAAEARTQIQYDRSRSAEQILLAESFHTRRKQTNLQVTSDTNLARAQAHEYITIRKGQVRGKPSGSALAGDTTQ